MRTLPMASAIVAGPRAGVSAGFWARTWAWAWACRSGSAETGGCGVAPWGPS